MPLIRDLPQHDRPRERLRDVGADVLSDQELLAIVLRTGAAGENALAQAQRLLAEFGGLAGLRRASVPELCRSKHIGPAKAAQLKAALALGFRLAQSTPAAREKVSSADSIAAMWLHEMSAFDQEHVRVVLLDSRNQVIAKAEPYIGSPHAAHVRIGDLLADAVRMKATALVLVHNHPSGDPSPSAEDIRLTKTLAEAAQLMGLELCDHVIIGGGKFMSLRSAHVPFAERPAAGVA